MVDYDYETFFSGNPGYAESLALQRDTPKEVILPFVPQIDSDGAVYGKDPSDRFLNDPQMTAETTGFSSMGRIRTMYWPVEMRQFLPIINTVRAVRIPGLRMESTMRCTGTE